MDNKNKKNKNRRKIRWKLSFLLHISIIPNLFSDLWLQVIPIYDCFTLAISSTSQPYKAPRINLCIWKLYICRRPSPPVSMCRMMACTKCIRITSLNVAKRYTYISLRYLPVGIPGKMSFWNAYVVPYIIANYFYCNAYSFGVVFLSWSSSARHKRYSVEFQLSPVALFEHETTEQNGYPYRFRILFTIYFIFFISSITNHRE